MRTILEFFQNISIMDIIKWVGIPGSVLMSIALFWKQVCIPVLEYVKASQKRIEEQQQMSIKIDQIGKQVNDIKKEVTTNGGGSLKDVTKRIETRQILSEQKAKVTANRLELAYVTFDKDGLCTESSLYLNRILNRSESELLGNQWLHWICPDDRIRVGQEWRDSVTNGVIFSSTYCVIRPDNTSIKVEAVVEPMIDGLGFFGTIEQIIETK